MLQNMKSINSMHCHLIREILEIFTLLTFVFIEMFLLTVDKMLQALSVTWTMQDKTEGVLLKYTYGTCH